MLPMRLASSLEIAPMRLRVQQDKTVTASTTSAITAMGNIALKSMETSRNLHSLIQLQNLSQILHPHQARNGTNGSAIVSRVATSLLKNFRNALPKRLAEHIALADLWFSRSDQQIRTTTPCRCADFKVRSREPDFLERYVYRKSQRSSPPAAPKRRWTILLSPRGLR